MFVIPKGAPDCEMNLIPFDAAVVMQKDRAEDLRRAGFTVLGRH
jgi:hypothetical protein